jgi:MFS family permease
MHHVLLRVKHVLLTAASTCPHLSGVLVPAGISASFLIGYSWLPSFFSQHVGIPTRLTLWMVLSCMIIFTMMVPVAGILSDKGLPRLTVTIAICIASAASAIPMFMGFMTKSVAICWLIQAILLAMSGYAMGMLPAVVSAIYPAGVRISGCNLGVNISEWLWTMFHSSA